MEKCSNCGLESNYLRGPMANLCESCYKILYYNELHTNSYIGTNKLDKEKEVDLNGKNNNP